MSAAERIADALGMRQAKPGQWRMRCPRHDGASNTSLAVWEKGNGDAGIYCFAGCDAGEVLATVGLTLAHLYADNWSRPTPAVGGKPPTAAVREIGRFRRAVRTSRHPLPDETGRVVAVHGRADFDDGTKDVWWERPDGTRGLGGAKVVNLPLCGVHELDGAAEAVVVEGEPAREALAGLGVPALGTVTGAKAVPSTATLRPLLAVSTVYLWPDNDDAGRSHMRGVASRLVALGHPDVRIVEWSDAPPKDDAADLVAAGGTVSDVRRLLDAAGRHEPRAEEQGDDAPAGKLRFLTAREFAAQTPATTQWVVEPWVPLGGTTKIDGPPKRAGKTTLITRMVAAVLAGAAFLGKPARRGPVVLLTEQAGTSFREALARAGLLDRDDLFIAVYRDIAALAWPDVVAQTFALAREVGAVLIVVDTFPQVSRVRGDDENSAGRALEALEPLQVGADADRIGVIVSFHDRKGGGEVGESGRGSSAYAGAVDVILHVSRPGGKLRPTVRKLEALSRFEATPDELYVELTDAGYVSLGTEGDVVTAMVANTLADVLPETQDEAKPVNSAKRKGEDGEEAVERGILDDLAARGVKAARSTVDAELDRWVTGEFAGQTGAGKKGSPYRYWLRARPPADFFRPMPSGASEETIAESIEPDGGPAGAGEVLPSDAPPPSEERNSVADEGEGDDPFLSSDAWDGYGGGTGDDDDGEDLWTA